MALRACHCRAHRTSIEPNATAAAVATAAPAAASPVPPHVAPTRALLLQLSRFPPQQLQTLQRAPADPAALELHSLHPHVSTLLRLSASMRLAWSAPPAAAACAERAAEEDAERDGAVALRLLGISTAERAASLHRAALLSAARSARRSSGASSVSPAADYPKLYGAGDVDHAQLELATNHLPLMMRVERARRHMLAEAADPIEVAHCNEPVFLATQQPNGAAECIAPFLPLPTPAPHSAVPLRSAADRGVYIQRILRHVASRLALDAADAPVDAAAAASSPSSVSPPAHILLLHIDAQSLLGAPLTADDPEHASAALRFVDQLLAALMTQLSTPMHTAAAASSSAAPAAAPATAAGSSAYPPPPPSDAAASMVAPPLSQSFSAACSSSAPTAPLHAAAQLFQSGSLCSALLWSCVIDDAEGEIDALPLAIGSSSSGGDCSAAASAAVVLRQSVLQSLRPVQSYRVADGCIAAPTTRWFSCDAFIFHSDSTRVSESAAAAHAEPPAVTDAASSSSFAVATASSSASCPQLLLPAHGRVHLTHFMRELLFKLGLGIKYGA